MRKKQSLPVKPREAALQALVRVEQDEAYLNLLMPSLTAALAGEDKALALQLAAGTIQRLNTLDWAINHFARRPLDTNTRWIRNLLRLGAYQLLYLDRIPVYAAIDETVKLARRYGHRGVAGLVNAVLRRLARESNALPWPDPESDPLTYLALKESHPFWLVSRALDRFGFREAEKWCRANNFKAPLSLRPNVMRTKIPELIKNLAAEGITVQESPLVPGMLRLIGGGNPASAAAFKEGLFSIQGESSAIVVPLLEPAAGKTFVDLCSAPGGKTTHLAELIGDQGLIIAVDLYHSRLQLVEKAARRLGLHSIKTMAADGLKIDTSSLPVPAAVLVDAPCSGLGVIRRLPEIKWRRREEELLTFHNRQCALLQAAADLLPPGGKLLYSVCTTEPEETGQVKDFFERHNQQFIPLKIGRKLPELLCRGREQDEQLYLWPHLDGLDGFYIAGWQKMR